VLHKAQALGDEFYSIKARGTTMRKPPYLGDDGIDPSTSWEKDIYTGWWLTYPSEK